MYTIKQLDFPHLSHSTLKNYRNMMEERHWRFLKNVADPDIIVLGIYKDNIPIGIASGQIFDELAMPNSPKRGEIFQIHLDDHSDELVGNVLEHLDQFFKDCHVVYLMLKPNEHLEQFLKKRGWEGPKRYKIHYTFDAKAYNADWFNKILMTPWPEGFRMFKWNVIKKSEWDQVKQQERNNAFPEEVNPFYVFSGPNENLNSLGLSYNGEVIGWVITHKIKGAIHYSSLYIQPDYQMQAWSLKLLAEAIKLQQASPIAKATMEINFKKAEPSWIRFVEKHLEPYAEKLDKEFLYTLKRKP